MPLPGSMFPPEYNGTVFMAQHGSWNRSPKDGYRLMNARVNPDGTTSSYTVFAEGWLQGADTIPNTGSWGMPHVWFCTKGLAS